MPPLLEELKTQRFSRFKFRRANVWQIKAPRAHTHVYEYKMQPGSQAAKWGSTRQGAANLFLRPNTRFDTMGRLPQNMPSEAVASNAPAVQHNRHVLITPAIRVFSEKNKALSTVGRLFRR
eukprot:SAG11_NODE_872_length_6802_cov_8.951514_8_plen_121_part_00